MLIANDRQRIAWLGVMLEEFPTDCLPDNFHAQSVLARQVLRSREEQLRELPGHASGLGHQPAAPTAKAPCTPHGAAQPATTLHRS